ncbi:DUF397 domain-containing protein [Streptomyces sp. NPDC002867]
MKHPAWFRSYAKLEAEAVEQHDYSFLLTQWTSAADDLHRRRVRPPAAYRWRRRACIEVAVTERAMLVRDSKDVTLPHLSVSHTGWADFVRYAIEG